MQELIWLTSFDLTLGEQTNSIQQIYNLEGYMNGDYSCFYWRFNRARGKPCFCPRCFDQGALRLSIRSTQEKINLFSYLPNFEEMDEDIINVYSFLNDSDKMIFGDELTHVIDPDENTISDYRDIRNWYEFYLELEGERDYEDSSIVDINDYNDFDDIEILDMMYWDQSDSGYESTEWTDN